MPRTLKEIVSEAVSKVSPAPSFYNGFTSFQNLVSDKTAMPAIYLDEPETSTAQIARNGAMREVFTVNIGAFDYARHDSTQDQHDLVAYPMKDLLKEICGHIFNNTVQNNDIKEIAEFGEITFTKFINMFDRNLSGFTASFTLVLTETEAFCQY